jgi:tetratricopeptide (TPR) repeat protein
VRCAGASDFHPFIARGLIRRALGQDFEAKADFEKAKMKLETRRAQNHKDRRILIPLANVYFYLGDYQTAERVLKRLLKLSTVGQKHYALAALGDLYERLGKVDRAIQSLEEVRIFGEYPYVAMRLKRLRTA